MSSTPDGTSSSLSDDLFAPDVVAEPYDYFARLRATDPVHWNERFALWVVTGYKQIVWILRHQELFSSAIMKNSSSALYPPIDEEDLPLAAEAKKFRTTRSANRW